MKFGTDGHGPQRMNPDFRNPQTFHLVHQLIKVLICPILPIQYFSLQ